MYCIKDVRICLFSAPTGSTISQINSLFFEYQSGDVSDFQLVIRDNGPADSEPGIQTVIETGVGSFRIVLSTFMKDFFDNSTSAKTVYAKGLVTVLPSGTTRDVAGAVVETPPVAFTLVQVEPTASPTKVSCSVHFILGFSTFLTFFIVDLAMIRIVSPQHPRLVRHPNLLPIRP